MEAWLARGVVGLGAGLGKKEVIVIPRKNGYYLAINFTRGGRIWIDKDEKMGEPSADDTLERIEIPEGLVEEVNLSFDLNNGHLTSRAECHLSEFITSLKSK